MIANKIESNGESGKLAVSQTTKDLIKNYDPDLYHFMPGKQLEISSIYTKINSFTHIK